MDWFDPNTEISKMEIGKSGTAVNATNIKYATYSLGYNYFMKENLKFKLCYDFVTNENTALTGYTSDVKDNVLTSRLQYRF